MVLSPVRWAPTGSMSLVPDTANGTRFKRQQRVFGPREGEGRRLLHRALMRPLP
jgi:hypothetical protein